MGICETIRQSKTAEQLNEAEKMLLTFKNAAPKTVRRALRLLSAKRRDMKA